MTKEEIKEMEEWCDWACGECSRTHIKWKAARLGYIRGVYITKQKLNKLPVMRPASASAVGGELLPAEGSAAIAMFMDKEVVNYKTLSGEYILCVKEGLAHIPIDSPRYPEFNYKSDWNALHQVVSKIAEYRLAYPKETSWVCDCKIVVYQRMLYREVVHFCKFFISMNSGRLNARTKYNELK